MAGVVTYASDFSCCGEQWKWIHLKWIHLIVKKVNYTVTVCDFSVDDYNDDENDNDDDIYSFYLVTHGTTHSDTGSHFHKQKCKCV